MALETVLTFEDDIPKATIQYSDNGNPISEWVYENGRVATPALPMMVDLDANEAYLGDVKVNRWIKYVTKIYEPAVTPVSKHINQCRKRNKKVEASLEFSGDSILDAVWEKDTGHITVQPRIAFDLAWSDYLLFVNAWAHLHQMWRNFE